MRKLFTFLLLGTLLLSCSGNDEPFEPATLDEPLITNLKIEMNRTGGWLPGTGLDFVFQYDGQNRMVKKTGNYRLLPNSTGFSGIFTGDIYTSLVYNNNKVTVKDFSSSPDFTIANDPIYYTVNDANQILEKQITGASSYNNKKLSYKYLNNRLAEITTTYPDRLLPPYNPNNAISTIVESFIYNSDGNLTKTESVYKENGIATGATLVRTFENYDSSTNPTKRFSLLEDYFYRSLSKNNFRKSTETFYYLNDPSNSTIIQWTFSYDANGNIIIY